MKITIARMASWLQHVSAHLPACLLALFAGWTGTFAGGAWGDSAALGHGALLVFVALYGRLGAAPSELGRRGGWLLAAFGTSLLASYLLSPVERAGRLGLLLLPAFLLVPSAVAGCWATVEQRRLGLRSWSLVVTGVAGWALFGWWQLETPRAALPLGHHNLLAAWLVITLPLAALSWREGGPGRILSGVAVLTGSAALLGTGSLGAALAVAAVGASLVLRTAWTAADAHRRRLWVASAIVVGLLLVQMPRLRQIAAGADFSATARWSYLEAGWRGLQHRPVFGWGPGAASWTISEHLRPIPGVHPPDQVVADLHCWPLQVAYEVGWSGLLLGLGLAVVFLRSRRSEPADPDLRRCALLGLAALGVVSTTGLSLAVSALPLAVVVALGAVLAAEQRSPPEPRSVGPRIAAVVAACVIGVCVLPLDRAHLAYDRAMSGLDRSQQIRHLRRAVELDPAFPLYQARLAWLEAENGLGEPAVARRALAAAEAARGLAPLWLAAGLHGQQAGEAWASEALQRACRLSPLGAMAPFHLTLEDAAAADPTRWTARALLAEPLLLAAVDWRDRQPTIAAAITDVDALDGVELWWRQALRDLPASLGEPGGPIQSLVLEMDGDDSPLSLFAFRRPLWPAYVARVDVFVDQATRIDLAPASRVRTTSGEVFQGPACGPGD